jgi:hypothetical protein
MQKEIVGCEMTRDVMGVKLTAVVKSIITWVEMGGTITYYASRQPVYILIESEQDMHVLRAKGEEITLEQVYSECPSIREDLVEGFPALLTQGH